MAAIPAGGSLVATTDYYRSECHTHHSRRTHCSFTHRRSAVGEDIKVAHRLYVQQQLVWQFGVQRRGHPSPSRTPQAGFWPLVVQFLLWEAARDDPTD
ncbi:hypothetical protein E3U43_013919 [Larimichthys crocea]|uniref:Uncharacterized protein n=1 Tax=Larimichthys crocea TaxID=215358 RepID=A0ACD3RAP6_LARCR|nr:hypothetical protein E3U43_013919 [Larimichthys crocea]